MRYNHKSICRLLFFVSLLLPAFCLTSCSDDDDDLFRPDGPVELSVTSNGTEVDALDFGTYGGNTLLTLVSNASWDISVSDNAEWLILSNRSGDPTVSSDPEKEDEPRYIKLTAEPLGKGETRSCVVTFRAADKVKTITVTQTQPSAADESGWETAVAATVTLP